MGFGLINLQNENPNLIDFGIISTNSDVPLEKRLKTIYNDIESVINQFNPKAMSVEGGFFGKNVKSALLLGHARGVAMLSASNNNIPVFEYSARKIKQSVTGNGNAHKSQVSYMVMKQLGLNTVNCPADASDALAIALCHLNQIKLEEL